MKLTAEVGGHYVALSAREDGYVDAGHAGEIAGLEIEVDGELRVNTNEGMGRKGMSVLSLSFGTDTGRALAVVLAERLGLPAFTEPEWRRIASVLKCVHGGSEIDALADRITGAYAETSS